MALEGPKVVYARKEDEHALSRALRLAREVEDILASATSADLADTQSAHSTRIVRAMAASLVDELEGLIRDVQRSNVS